MRPPRLAEDQRLRTIDEVVHLLVMRVCVLEAVDPKALEKARIIEEHCREVESFSGCAVPEAAVRPFDVEVRG